MIEDMAARKLNPRTQRSHISSCKRFTAWLNRSPDTATPEEVRRFQLYLVESGTSICNRNRIMTGVRFLFRVTLRRHDLAAEVWHIKEVPWRFLDAGQLSVRSVFVAGVQKPAHLRKLTAEIPLKT
jgi:hypothetical protein